MLVVVFSLLEAVGYIPSFITEFLWILQHTWFLHQLSDGLAARLWMAVRAVSRSFIFQSFDSMQVLLCYYVAHWSQWLSREIFLDTWGSAALSSCTFCLNHAGEDSRRFLHEDRGTGCCGYRDSLVLHMLARPWPWFWSCCQSAYSWWLHRRLDTLLSGRFNADVLLLNLYFRILLHCLLHVHFVPYPFLCSVLSEIFFLSYVPQVYLEGFFSSLLIVICLMARLCCILLN